MHILCGCQDLMWMDSQNMFLQVSVLHLSAVHTRKHHVGLKSKAMAKKSPLAMFNPFLPVLRWVNFPETMIQVCETGTASQA